MSYTPVDDSEFYSALAGLEDAVDEFARGVKELDDVTKANHAAVGEWKASEPGAWDPDWEDKELSDSTYVPSGEYPPEDAYSNEFYRDMTILTDYLVECLP